MPLILPDAVSITLIVLCAAAVGFVAGSVMGFWLFTNRF